MTLCSTVYSTVGIVYLSSRVITFNFRIFSPLLAAVSYREPVSIHKPTVAVGTPLSSVATRMPLSSTDTSVGGRFKLTAACAL